MINSIWIFLVLGFENYFVRSYHISRPENLKNVSSIEKNISTNELAPDKNSREFLIPFSREKEIHHLEMGLKICPFNNINCELHRDGLNESEIENILKQSKNYDEILYLWQKWKSNRKDKKKVKPLTWYKNNLTLLNHLEDNIDKMWRSISPIYFEMHRYLERILESKFCGKFNFSNGLIPIYLLGSSSSDSWINVLDITKPYPEIDKFTTDENDLNEKFELINDFYVSLDLFNITKEFNFTYRVDEEQKINCAKMPHLLLDTACHYIQSEKYPKPKTFAKSHGIYMLSFLQYFLITKTPWTWPSDWSCFESMDDLITILSFSPYYVREINGLDIDENAEKENLNYLMEIALEKIVYLSHIYNYLQWSKNLKDNPSKNVELWEFRQKNQKIETPPGLPEITDPNEIASTRKKFLQYFVATILEFQLFKKMCEFEKETESESTNLRNCDLYASIESGEMLRNVLDAGVEENWAEILLNITGDTELSAEGLVEFFEPLHSFLKDKNGPLTEKELSLLLENEYEDKASYYYNKLAKADWDSATDITNLTKKDILIKTTLEVADFEEHYREHYFQEMAEETLENDFLQRQIEFLSVIGNSALKPGKLSELTNITSTMTNVYNSAKICPFENKKCNIEREGISLEPEIENILASSRNPEVLLYVWDAWRNATGVKIKKLYPSYVNLSNEAATENGFSDTADMWVSDFESNNFEEEVEDLWRKLKPLYDELHFYVSQKLKTYYGNKIGIREDLIPAHLLGNMWGQSWINIRDIVKPFPEIPELDVTSSLLKHNYSVKKMFETADDFYQSLGLNSVALSYNTNTTFIEKPEDKEIECHASAWDFYDKKDFRIKMCTTISYEDFLTIHHEMGHIHYYMLYKNQPITFRNAANPGFHEAIGDVITLSAITPKHLKKIDLIQEYHQSYEASINSLMNFALEKVAFIPFGYLLDKWRWDVFKGEVPEEKWNSRWWLYREKIQKIKPPIKRDDDVHFDPGSKFHIPNDYQYMSYFIAHVLQFQLYKSFCILAEEYDPKNASSFLHECDVYNSTKVGDKLRAGLSLGASVHWKKVLEEMTGENEYDPSALLEYFDPLYQYLLRENKSTKEIITINGTSHCCEFPNWLFSIVISIWLVKYVQNKLFL